jgi:hypothetical protein
MLRTTHGKNGSVHLLIITSAHRFPSGNQPICSSSHLLIAFHRVIRASAFNHGFEYLVQLFTQSFPNNKMRRTMRATRFKHSTKTAKCRMAQDDSKKILK